ncbi:MAG: GNAT family N-acetyltransferase [Acidimicrobiales bacterium]|jgi:RimJ/RimL family protein N-acetyltransferase
MSDRLNELAQPIGFPIEGWQHCPVPPRTAMDGRFCRLEPTDATLHADQLHSTYTSATDGKDWTYLPYGPFDSQPEFTQWLQSVSESEDPLFHTVVDTTTALAIGLASYLRIDPALGVIEVGHIHFSPLLQRKPAATEAMFLMMQRVFDELGYRRYEWKCDSLNAPSKRAAARLGFQHEGTFRQATMYKGRNRDTDWFSILDTEWPKLRSAYEQWLAPSNFDARGQQRSSLGSFT